MFKIKHGAGGREWTNNYATQQEAMRQAAFDLLQGEVICVTDDAGNVVGTLNQIAAMRADLIARKFKSFARLER